MPELWTFDRFERLRFPRARVQTPPGATEAQRMRSWKRRPGAPPRAPHLTLTPETPDLLMRLSKHLERDPAEIVFQALRLFAAVFQPPPDSTKTKTKTRGGPVTQVDVKGAVDNIIAHHKRRSRNANRKP